MTRMDRATAMRIVTEQRLAAWGRARPWLVELGQEAGAMAETVSQQRQAALVTAKRWAGEAQLRLRGLGLDETQYGDLFNPSLNQESTAWGRVPSVIGLLEHVARKLRDPPGVPEGWLQWPEEVHAPRYARLSDGMLARLYAEDLAACIEAGRALAASIAAGTETLGAIEAWSSDVREFIHDGLSHPVSVDFATLQGYQKLSSASFRGSLSKC
jgi:hypothetical protein